MNFFDSVFADQDRERRDRSVHGLALAKVTGRMGDGTYELTYLSMGGATPSAPARMMMPNAGKQRGFHWMPETGDEVVVAFEGGDSNAPIILGALYNAESPAPEQAKPSNDNHVRTLVSRSGHEFTFDDSPAAGQITVRTKDGRRLHLDDTLPGKITLETPNGLALELDDATGTLTLRAPTAIKLESASLLLSVGGLAIAPGATPGTGAMNITLPAAVTIQSAAIALNAAVITLTTTGTMPTSLVVIDGKPFGLHVHGLPLPAPPVTPPVQP